MVRWISHGYTVVDHIKTIKLSDNFAKELFLKESFFRINLGFVFTVAFNRKA